MTVSKALLAGVFLIFSLLAKAQVDSLGKPNVGEKASALSALYQLEDFLNKYAANDTEENKKQAALKLIKEGLSSASVALPNDLDKSEKRDYAMVEYGKRLSTASDGKWTVRLSNFVPNQMAFDKLRRKYFLVVKATKITEIESIEEGTGDTLVEEKVQPLLFYFRFDRIQNVSSNFKLFDVAQPGEPFDLEPLSELVEWWLGLDKEWRTYFRQGTKLTEYPGEVELLHLINRNVISLEGSTFKTLEPLKKFPKLQSLNLRNSSISDLTQLKGFTKLNILHLEGTKTTSLHGVETLTSLRVLTAAKMGITSAEPIRNLIYLEELDLSENAIEDISPLSGLVNLRKLNLSLNDKIRDVSVLKNMRAIQELSLAKIDIKNLDILKEMEFLDKLNIFNTGIKSLEPLRGLTKLSQLDIGFNVINTLEPIKGMLFLIKLNVAGTGISDLNPLSNFKFLRTLDCSNNPRLTALGPVVGLDDVEELKCFYTKIDKNEVQQFKRKHVRCKITFY